MRSTTWQTTASAWALALGLVACGQAENFGQQALTASAPPASGSTAQAETVPISGRAAMGPIQNGTVEAFAIDASGELDLHNPRGRALTDAHGDFRLEVRHDGDPALPIGLLVRGGTYLDEATGRSFALDANEDAEVESQLQVWLPRLGEASQVAVTSLTTMAASFARQALKAGGAGDVQASIGRGRDQVRAFLSDGNQTFVDFDFVTTLPTDLTRDDPAGDAKQSNYGAILAGFSSLGQSGGEGGEKDGGKRLLKQLVQIAKQAGEVLEQRSADGPSAVSLSPSLLSASDAQGLRKLATAIWSSLPRAIDDFVSDPKRNRSGRQFEGMKSLPLPPEAHGWARLAGSVWLDRPVEGATVAAFVIDANAARVPLAPPPMELDPTGAQAQGTATTRADGSFGFIVPDGAQGLVFRATGGVLSWPDGRRADLPPQVELFGAAVVAPGQTTPTVAITALSTLTARRRNVLGGLPGVQAQAFAEAMAKAAGDVRAALGLDSRVDVWSTEGLSLLGRLEADARPRIQVTALAGALRSLVASADNPVGDLGALGAVLRAFAADLANGQLDSRDELGHPVSTGLPQLAWPNAAGSLGARFRAYVADSQANQSGQTDLELELKLHL